MDLKYVLIKSSGIPAVLNWCYRHRPLVLAYHGIYDGPKRTSELPATFVHVSDVEEQIHWVKTRYRILTPEDLLNKLEKNASFESNSALITFDDGYESYYRLAEPVTRKLEVRPIVFIATEYLEKNKPFWFDLAWLFMKHTVAEEMVWLLGVLDIRQSPGMDNNLSAICLRKMKALHPEKRKGIIAEMTERLSRKNSRVKEIQGRFMPMTSEQIKKLSTQGTMFGGHSHTHTILSSLSPPLAQLEIKKNKEILESLLGTPCKVFAYPNGEKKDFGEEHKRMLRSSGFLGAFSLTQERSSAQDDPMAISRVNVAPEDSLVSLSLRCTGIVPLWSRLRPKRWKNMKDREQRFSAYPEL